MSRIRIALAGAVAAAALLAPAAVHATASKTVLKGTDGPGFTITLKDAKGKKVTKVRAGVYAFKISDKSSIHSFVLEQQKGGGFEKDLTTVPFAGTKTVVVTLHKGKYKFYCRAHESTMFGFFTVS